MSEFRSGGGIGRAPGLRSAVVLCFAFFAIRAEAELVTYQKGDGKGIISETDDTTFDQTVPNTTWIDDGQDVTHIEVDLSPERHTVLKFPNIFGGGANQIQPGSVIISATLTLRLDNEGTDCPDVYQLTEGWTELEATWNSRKTGVSWSDPGADGTTSHKTVAEGTLPCLLPLGFKNVDVTTSVQNWSDGELNEGWVFVDTGASTNGANYRSSEHATQGDHPQLTVDYIPAVFYSVGTDASDLKTGSPMITIASGVATLDVAQTNDIGVGDVIDYDSPSSLVYIFGVISPTQFRVQTATGGLPGDVGAAVSVNSIKRAFNSIAQAVTESSDGNHLNNTSLPAVARGLTWVCYDDTPFNVSTTTTINGYTTDTTYFITLTVAGADQVATGNSQRHGGVAGTGVSVQAQAASMAGGAILIVDEPFTVVEWLEIDGNSFVDQDGILLDTGGTASLLRHLLVHDIGANSPSCPTSPTVCIGIDIQTNTVEVRNSFIYDYGQDGIDVNGTGVVIANVTLFRSLAIGNVGEGLQISGTSVVTGENVIAIGNGPDFWNSGGTLTLNNCLSSDATSQSWLGSGNLIGADPAKEFVSLAGPVDLHSRPGADAIDAGIPLSGRFSDDIDRDARPQGTAWDIGGDESFSSGATTHYRSIGVAMPHGTGTVNVRNLAQAVAGVGTGWSANNRGRGDVITIPCPDPPTCSGGTHYTILAVDTDNSLRLTESYPGATTSGLTYLVRRQYSTFEAWWHCVDSTVACAYFPASVTDPSLIVDDRSEVGVAYDDASPSFTLTTDVRMNGATTDALHTIRLTADGVNRHYGVPGAGVVVDANGPQEISIRTGYFTLEWLEFVGCRGGLNLSPVEVWGDPADSTNDVVLQYLLIHDFNDGNNGASGIDITGAAGSNTNARPKHDDLGRRPARDRRR